MLTLAGCGQGSPTTDAPTAAATATAPAEPPRLLRETIAEKPMESPLLLQGASESAGQARPGSGLSLPPADRSADGTEVAAGIGEQTTIADPSAENLLLPPTDRGPVATSQDEAPLPELVPFETPAALAEHAGDPPAGAIDAATAAAGAHPGKPEAAQIVAGPEGSPRENNQPPIGVSADAAHNQLPDAAPRTDSSTIAGNDQPAGDSALPTTGALTINKVESIAPADGRVARIEMSTGSALPAQSTEPPAAAKTAPRQAVVSAQPPVPAAASAGVAAGEQTTETLTVSTPPALPAAPTIAPTVDRLEPRAPSAGIADAGKREDSTAAIVPGGRRTASSPAPLPSTTAAPPAQVALQPGRTAASRAPLPASELPRQAPIVSHSRPDEPSSATGVARRVTSPDPAALAGLGGQPANGPPAMPGAGTSASQPVVRPLREPLHGGPSANRPPAVPRTPIAVAPPVAPHVPAPTSPAAVAGQPAPAMVAAGAGQRARRPLESADRSLPPVRAAAAPPRSGELMAVSRMADEHTRHAFNLANRGAMYSARDEFIEALQMVAHAIDAEHRSYERSQALADGLTAIRESDDFSSRGGRLQDNIDVVSIAKAHSTPVLKGLEPRSVSRLAAMQQYYTYAQRRLAFAVSPEPSGSVALYGLGKLYTVLAQSPPQGIVAPEPKAIVFHQAALLVDGRNYMAANDLGVLLARYGRYQQSKAALLHSLSVSPQPAAWHNLTVVHQQLGEAKLAQLAQAETQAAKARVKQAARASGQSVTDTTTVVWLDPVTFSRSSEFWSDPAKQPAPEAVQPSTASNPPLTPPADSPKKGWFRK